ncbi:MAG: hypothetical protein RIA63_06555, partial [Cyclobacteriaceae bacterium]
MNKSLLKIVVLLLAVQTICFSQSPNAFKYQAIVRSGNGLLLSNQAVSLRISILKTSVGGEIVYSETHSVTTTETGAVNLEIGKGIIVFGDFSAILWGNDSHFVKVEMDKNGGTAFEPIGISQLLSVPYSLYSQRSGDDDWDNVNNGITYLGGNVGIGKSVPNFKLDVNGTINATSLIISGSPLSPAPWIGNSSMVYFNSGNVGIGTSTPTTKLEINGNNDLNLLNLRNQNNSLGINAYVSSDTDFHGSALIGRRSRGTYLTPQTVLEGDRISGIYGSLFANGNYQNSSAIHFYVGPSPGNNSYPSNIRFETTASGSVTRLERMRITET